jgi:hypothetical protein
MAKICIFHNVNEDASFGFNTVFRTTAEAPEGVRAIELSDGRFTWKDAAHRGEEHELVFVFAYDVELAGIDPERYLEVAWQTFNIGDDQLAAQYRSRKLRSLSKGDVVMIDRQPYSCESVGWQKRSMNELRILPARQAERAIRSRFQMKPDEELTVTVPLPD